MRFTGTFLLLCLMLLPFTRCSDADTGGDHLGSVAFQPTGKQKAIPYFEKGLLLLHSFEYTDAATEFRKARKIDPDFAMAYWGEAMTKHHTLWRAQYTDEAREILAALGPNRDARLAKAQTPLERDFLEGVEILFGEGEKLERDKAYARHMQAMYEKYPDNTEVAAFYALSLLGSVDGRDEALYGKSAKIAQGVIRENPDHPGALHYLIHSYDDPGHAHLALPAANSYSKVAPDATHALHMPSHIYIAMGMWDEVISSNIASWDASVKRMERLDDKNARSYHALHWLFYGYLQRAEFDKAHGLLRDMIGYTEELPSESARAYLTSMRAGYLVDAPQWDDSLAALEIDDSDLNISVKSVNNFVRGLQAWHDGDAAALSGIITGMREQRDEASAKMMQRGAAMCSGVEWAAQLPNQTDINHAHVMEMELQALLASLKGEPQQAEMWFNEATALEDATSFTFGPPSIVKPSHELYAEWLVKRDPVAAKTHFKKTLEKCPGRRIATEGLASVTMM